jgi:hypothetical protein
MKNGDMISISYFGLEVKEEKEGRSVRVYSKTGGYDHTDGLDPDGTASFQIDIGGIDVKTTPIYGAWGTPYESIQNLPHFDMIDLGLNSDRTQLVLNVRPVKGLDSSSITIQVFVLHEVR